MADAARRAAPNPSAGADGTHAKRRASTPLLLQMHATECGAACLGSVLAHFGRWVPLTELRSRCEVSRDGSSAAGILRAARHYGLACKGWHGDVAALRKRPLPVILFWEFNHFLILEGFDGDRFFLNDPATGRRTLSAEEFSRGFSGVALEFEAGPEFRPGGAPIAIAKRLPLWLHGSWGAIAQVLAAGLMLALLALATPFLLGVFVDRVFGENEPWGGTLAGVMAGAAVLVYGLAWVKQRCLRRLSVRISVIAGDRFLTRLLRLPVEYFNHRLVGDLTVRVLSIDRIARGLSDHVLDVLVEIAMSVVFLAVMLVWDPVLASIVLGLAVLNAALVRVIARIRTDRSHALRREQGLLLGVGTVMLHQAETLRMTAADDSFFSRWSGHQARELDARQRFAELGHVVAALPGLFAVFGNVAVLAFGATRVMAGEMTLGTLAGFYIVAAMFLAPVGRSSSSRTSARRSRPTCSASTTSPTPRRIRALRTPVRHRRPSPPWTGICGSPARWSFATSPSATTGVVRPSSRTSA